MKSQGVSWLLFTWGPTRMVCLGWAGERAVAVLGSGGGVTVPVVGGRVGIWCRIELRQKRGQQLRLTAAGSACLCH